MSKNIDKKLSFYGIILLLLISLTTIIITNYNKYYENRTTNEIKKNTVIIKDGKLKKENEGKLVLVSGKLEYNNEILHDDLFWINIKTPKLLRYIEMYQWYEYTEKGKNGKKIYKYGKKWSHNIINSSNFKKEGHDNPKYKVRGTMLFKANDVKIGDYKLSEKQMKKLPCNTRLKLSPNIPLYGGFRIYDNYVINSENPENPQIGDNRISYYYNDWDYGTVLAKQSNNTFEDYIAKTKKPVNIIKNKKLNLEKIINFIKK